MRLQLSVLSLSLMALTAVNTVYAMEVNGTVTSTATVTDPTVRMATPTQPVVLMKVKLSKEELRALNGIRKLSAKSKTSFAKSNYPATADVNMRDTPVLNQGMHGTCVTFAVTAALDSLIGKGDYISQLCSLELGSYLEENAYTYSGWKGSYGTLVLNQLMTYGMISQTKQKEYGCAGVYKYPTHSAGEGNPINIEEYRKLSEKVNDFFYWESILTRFQSKYSATDHEFAGDEMVDAVKKELSTQRTGRETRIVFATILPRHMCSSGACGTYHAKNDTWTLTRAMDHDFENRELAGHAMMITGYDDNAVVIDNEGDSHQGVFKLRNSWGVSVGDRGNYYMTYDYFKRFAEEVERVVKSDESLEEDR